MHEKAAMQHEQERTQLSEGLQCMQYQQVCMQRKVS